MLRYRNSICTLGYMEAARDWIQELFKKIRPYLYGNGGPIIMVQVRNMLIFN